MKLNRFFCKCRLHGEQQLLPVRALQGRIFWRRSFDDPISRLLIEPNALLRCIVFVIGQNGYSIAEVKGRTFS